MQTHILGGDQVHGKLFTFKNNLSCPIRFFFPFILVLKNKGHLNDASQSMRSYIGVKLLYFFIHASDQYFEHKIAMFPKCKLNLQIRNLLF